MGAVIRSIPAAPYRHAGGGSAAATRFFASPDAAYITGQTLSVNGGLTMP